MGCDEPVEVLVGRAALSMAGLEWVGQSERRSGVGPNPSHQPWEGREQTHRPPGQKNTRRGARKASSPAGKPPRLTRQEIERQSRKQPLLLPAVTERTASEIDARIASWKSDRRYLTIGNLGEQVALRVLDRLGYQVLATQDELRGGRRENPEDFTTVFDGRFVTVNSKAAVALRSTRIGGDGSLQPAKMAKGQNDPEYYSSRAAHLTPIEGQAFGQVIKVDLVNKLAQVFDLGPAGEQTPAGAPIPILEDLAVVCLRHRDSDIPAPNRLIDDQA